jgi:mannan endo-1,4-beta-mannosidase
MNRRMILKRGVLISLLVVFLPALVVPIEAAGVPFWGLTLNGYPIKAERLADLQDQTGLTARMVVFFLQWPAPGEKGPFPGESMEAIWSGGAVPCLTWEPMYYREGREITVPAEAILGGKYDEYLHTFADSARRWKRPFLIRFAHEMNLERYHWGTERGGYGPGSPELYRKMFRYVVDLFRRDGAENVKWIFCPNAESVPNLSSDSGASWNTPESYFPGEDVVDVLGMDGYNWGDAKTKSKDGWLSRWQSFREIFEPLYVCLKRIAPVKPVIVFETASVTSGGDRTVWLREAMAAASAWDLRGVCWFQVEKEVDWRLELKRDMKSIDIVREKTSTGEIRIEGWSK